MLSFHFHTSLKSKGKPRQEIKDLPGRWAGKLPKERIYEIRQKARQIEANFCVIDNKQGKCGSPKKQQFTPKIRSENGQQRTPYREILPSIHNDNRQTKTKFLWSLKERDAGNGGHHYSKCNSFVTNDGRPRFKSDWPKFFSSIVAKHPKKRKTQGKVSKNKISAYLTKKCLNNSVNDLDQTACLNTEHGTPILPIRPLASPVKFSNSQSVEIFELRKTATPNLSSLAGKGAFTSYCRLGRAQPSPLLGSQEPSSRTSEQGLTLTSSSFPIDEVPPVTSKDVLNETAIMPPDQQHNQARHNTRFLNASTTEPHSSSNDCSLMTEQRLPVTHLKANQSSAVQSNLCRNDFNHKTKLEIPTDDHFRFNGAENANKGESQQRQLSKRSRSTNFLRPLLKGNKARTISLSQESRSKAFGKSFSINLQLKTEMFDTPNAKSAQNETKNEMRKASPLQFEMPMQEPVFSDIIQTLHPTSKTIGAFCAKKSGMGAYLDKASKRNSIPKALTENNMKKINNNSKHFTGPAITRQPHGKLKGNTVFRITRNRVTTLKSQQGQKTPHAADLGLLTRKQLFQLQSNSAERGIKPIAGCKSQQFPTTTAVGNKATPAQGCVFPKQFKTTETNNQALSEREKTFRVRRIDGTDGKVFHWQLSPDINKCTTKNKTSFDLPSKENIGGQNMSPKSFSKDCEPKKLLIAKQTTVNGLPCQGWPKAKGLNTRKDWTHSCAWQVPPHQQPQHAQDPKHNSKHSIQNDLKKQSFDSVNKETMIPITDSHLTSDREMPFSVNTDFHIDQPMCSSSNSRSSCNVNNFSASSSFDSIAEATNYYKESQWKRFQRRRQKKSKSVSSVCDVLSKRSGQYSLLTQFKSSRYHSPSCYGKLHIPSSKACKTMSPVSSLRQQSSACDDRKHVRNKKSGKRMTAKENSIESKHIHKNNTNSPCLSREESVKDNYVRYYKMKKTKLLRHEPYNRRGLFHRKEKYTIPRSHKAYQARNKNNCSPLNKNPVTLNDPMSLGSLGHCASHTVDSLGMPCSLRDRQMEVGDDHPFFCKKRDTKLDLDSEMCTVHLCQRKDHIIIKNLPQSPNLTPGTFKRLDAASSTNENPESTQPSCQLMAGVSSSIDKDPDKTQSKDHMHFKHLVDATFRQKVSSAHAEHFGNDRFNISPENSCKYHKRSQQRRILNITRGHQDGEGESLSDPISNSSAPKTQSHMTQTEASTMSSSSVAIQTSPDVLCAIKGLAAKRLKCKSTHLIHELMKHRVRELRLERSFRHRHFRHRQRNTIGENSNKVCQAALFNDANRLIKSTSVNKDFYDVPTINNCSQEQVSMKQDNRNNYAEGGKTKFKTQLVQEDKSPNNTDERMKQYAFNNLGTAGIATDKISCPISPSDTGITAQFTSLEDVTDGSVEEKDSTSKLTDGDNKADAFKVSQMGISSNLTQIDSNPQEKTACHGELNSPKICELRRMCLVRPSWKNINVEEVDRRVKRALRLRRDLQLSRSSGDRRENSSLTPDSVQDSGSQQLLFNKNKTEAKQHCQGLHSFQGSAKNDCPHNSHNIDECQTKNHLSYPLSSNQDRNSDKQKKNHCLWHNSTKNNDGSVNTTYMKSGDCNSQLHTNSGIINSAHRKSVKVSCEKNVLDLSSRTEQSMSQQDLMTNAETVQDPERQSSTHPPTQSDNTYDNKRNDVVARHNYSPPSKISRVGKCGFSNATPRLVGSLVQRLPQVPLSSFVEWFIETSDPKHFITSDKSCASSEEKDSGNKSISSKDIVPMAKQQSNGTEHSRQPSERLRFHTDALQLRSPNKSSIQTLTIAGDVSISNRHDQREHHFSKTSNNFSKCSSQKPSSNFRSCDRLDNMLHSLTRKLTGNETESEIYSETKDMDTQKLRTSTRQRTCSSDPTTPLAFKPIALKTNKTSSVTQNSSGEESQVENHQKLNYGTESAGGVNSQTYTCDDDTNVLNKSIDTDKIYIEVPLRSSSGDGDDDDTDFIRDNDDDQAERQTCSSNNSNYLLNWNSGLEASSSCASTDQLKTEKGESNWKSEKVATKSHISPLRLCHEDIKSNEGGGVSVFQNDEIVPNSAGNKERNLDEKCGPGIRHILMQLRHSEIEPGCSKVSDKKSGRVRITLRRSSDVSGIVAKFQNKNNNSEN